MGAKAGHDMFDCRRVFAALSEYLDAELPPEACEQIRAHVADCPPCVEFLKSLERSVELVHHFECEERPGPLPEQVRERLRAAFQKAAAARR